ncbi:hypothetical protein [Paraburkholderia lacunae]|uniref:Carboxypeptidase regulatory-like domain-containing protein n=1 Tax=Paraburkholderia lacunae TaxID=2211104 RepID=A0A370MVF4_9BURK|nr:hypothetical protein [Paraburkholderia lacunae]RDJ97322.1 hypothetical protein DLM46_38170 [Paraburkholderia lacunae]
MNTWPKYVIRSSGSVLLATFSALLAACGGGGGGSGANNMPTTMAFSGTTATGKALANAAIRIDCVHGSTSVAADSNGNYHATLGAVPPCLITSTSGATVLLSTAFAGGTYNVTPETDLLLSYLAAQLGTTESGLVAGIPTDTRIQQALANQNNVLTAETAVVQNLQQRYSLTLTTPNFLTSAFVVGQPGVDSDLEALRTSGAIDANGEPDPAAISLMTTAGAAHPIATSPASGTGGTGGSGGTGAGTGSMGGMM